jgi:hypothetical protein
MAQKSFLLPVSGDEWLNLNDLIRSMQISLNRDPISPFCQILEIISNKDNDAASRLLITSDPTPSGSPAYFLLPEQTKIFEALGGANTISLQDKWIKLVDQNGVGNIILGDAIAVVTQA